MKVEGTEKDNMPCPPSQLETQIMSSNHQVLQKKMANLKATLPSRTNASMASSNATDVSLANMPSDAGVANRSPDASMANLPSEAGVTAMSSDARVAPLPHDARVTDMSSEVRVDSYTVTDARMPTLPSDARVAYNINNASRETETKPMDPPGSDCLDQGDWPEGDSDKELEEEMLRLAIKHEKEKEERFKEVERRRKDDDLKFLMDVKTIEDREERLERSRKKTEEARRKAKDQLLKKVPASSSSSSPGTPPNLQAKMPTGAEPWCLLEKRIVPQGKEDEMPVEEGAVPTSIPAGPAPSTSAPGTNIVHRTSPTKQGGCTTMLEHQDDFHSKVDRYSATEVIQETRKKMEIKLQPSQAEQKRLQLDMNRKKKRLDRMSSSRNLPEASTDPGPTPGASQKVSKLVSRFETAPSPIKMPRPTPTSTPACRTTSSLSISLPFLTTVSSPQLQYQPGTGSDVTSKK